MKETEPVVCLISSFHLPIFPIYNKCDMQHVFDMYNEVGTFYPAVAFNDRYL
jgi:hypothetical protein